MDKNTDTTTDTTTDTNTDTNTYTNTDTNMNKNSHINTHMYLSRCNMELITVAGRSPISLNPLLIHVNIGTYLQQRLTQVSLNTRINISTMYLLHKSSFGCFSTKS